MKRCGVPRAAVILCMVYASAQQGWCFPIFGGTQPLLLAVDADLDGFPDLLVLNRDESLLTLHLSQGAGLSFVESGSIETMQDPSSMVSGILFGDDEFPDVVVYNTQEPFATLAFVGRGGKFSLVERNFLLEDPTPQRVLGLGDVDEDGLMDLLEMDPSGIVRIRSPLIDTQDAIVLDSPVRDPQLFVLGDFNGDSTQDLVLWGNGVSSHLVVYEGQRGGQFSDSAVFETLPNPGGEPLGAVAADFDRDGRDELLLLSRSAEQMLGFLFVVELEQTEYEVFRLGSEVRLAKHSALLVGDVDRDGFPDALIHGRSLEDEEVTWILRNEGEERISFRVSGVVKSPGVASSLELADFDNDGFLDLAIALPGEESVEVLFSVWEHSEPVETCYDLAGPFVNEAARAIVTGDFADSGGESLLVAGPGTARILSLAPDGVAEIAEFSAPSALGGYAAGDLDQKGADDFVLTDRENEQVIVYLLGDAGRLTETRHLPVGVNPGGVCLEDFDENGRLDIAAALTGEGTLVVFLQGGDGSFLETRHEVGIDPDLIGAGDVNGDGLVDLVVTGKESGHAAILRGTGGGRFGVPARAPIIRGASSLATGDLDGDGTDEIAVLSMQANGLTILRGRGDTIRSQFIALAHGSLPTAIVIEDLDRDGLMEIAIGNSGSKTVTIFEMSGDGRLSSKPVELAFPPVIEGAVTLAVGDMDRNGWRDLILGDVGTGKISLYLSSGCARESMFRRGDTNVDGSINASDAVNTLLRLFGGGEDLPCPDAADTDDDGNITLNDAVALLGHLFSGGSDPMPPGPDVCGRDPTNDDLSPCKRSWCF